MADALDESDSQGQGALFRALHEIAVAIGGVLDPPALGEVVAERARHLLGADGVGMQTWDASAERLLPLYFSDAHELGQPTPTPLGQGVSGRAARERRPVYVENYQKWPTAHPWAASAGIASACGVPLIAGGFLVGTLVVRYYEPHHFTDRDLDVLSLLATLVAPALNAARLHRQLQNELEERKRAEAAVVTSERRFRSLIEQGGDVVFTIGDDGTITYISGSIERLAGWRVEDLVGQPCLQLVHPDDVERAAGVFRKLATEAGARECIELRARDRLGAWQVWEADASSHLDDPALGAIVVNARDVTDRVAQHRRQDALLRLGRRLSYEKDATAVMRLLLEEAALVASADAGTVFRWDREQRDLVAISSTVGTVHVGLRVPLGAGASGLAAERRQPVIQNDYPSSPRPAPEAIAAGFQAAMAVPLLHEGSLFGVLAVATFSAERRFTQRDLEPLELMAGIAAGSLAGLERARLEGVLLAARTAQHHLNNQLALTVGYCELLLSRGGLSDEARRMAREALLGANRATETLRNMLDISQLKERDFGPPGGSILDLPASPPADRGR